MTRPVHVDHDEIAQKRREMEDILSELMTLRNSLDSITTSMVSEASANTSDGAPAPIFGPLLNASTEAVERVKKSLDAVHYRVSADLDILSRMSEEVRAHGEDAARGIDTTAHGGFVNKPRDLGNAGAFVNKPHDLDSPGAFVTKPHDLPQPGAFVNKPKPFYLPQ